MSIAASVSPTATEKRRTALLWAASLLGVSSVEALLAFLLVRHPAEVTVAAEPAAMSVTMTPIPVPTPAEQPQPVAKPPTLPSPPSPAPDPPPQPVDAPPSPAPPTPVSRPLPHRVLPHRRHPIDPVPKTPLPEQATERQVAPAAAAPAQHAATTPVSPAVRASWQGALLARLEQFKRYPAAAQAQGQEGVASVRFTMDRSGHVLSASLQRSSGSALLDAEALALPHRAEPLPSPPDGVGCSTLVITAPVQFSMDAD